MVMPSRVLLLDSVARAAPCQGQTRNVSRICPWWRGHRALSRICYSVAGSTRKECPAHRLRRILRSCCSLTSMSPERLGPMVTSWACPWVQLGMATRQGSTSRGRSLPIQTSPTRACLLCADGTLSTTCVPSASTRLPRRMSSVHCRPPLLHPNEWADGKNESGWARPPVARLSLCARYSTGYTRCKCGSDTVAPDGNSLADRIHVLDGAGNVSISLPTLEWTGCRGQMSLDLDSWFPKTLRQWRVTVLPMIEACLPKL